MTTPRTRRSKPRQARDILLALLKDQDALTAKCKAAYEEANLRATSTRRAIELLDQAMLPGMETLECVCGYNPENGYRLDVLCVAHPRPLFPVPVGRQPEEPPRIVYVPRPLEGTGDKPFIASDTWQKPKPQEEVLEPIAEYDTQTKTTKWTNPRRQRIGKKAQDVNDVWPAPELGPTNHSKLMYERAKNCQLCLAGVPYATKKRTEHYVVTKDSAGVERGFEYQPCKGAA